MKQIDNTQEQAGSDCYNNIGYDIEFKDVHFSYNEEPVLAGVSFVAKQGEITALVGPSGSGKSTVSKLAARFWDADSGLITLGGIDVKTVEPEVLLKNYAIVFQNVTLFDESVMENIRLGRSGASDEDVRAAAKAAQCDEFIDRLPQGYDTNIGENGSKLSGGERQRISIARALLKNAPVILLDEATASMDAESETMVQTALSALLKGRTVIVIAHRMRTMDCCGWGVSGNHYAGGFRYGQESESEFPSRFYRGKHTSFLSEDPVRTLWTCDGTATIYPPLLCVPDRQV